jgi:hypothetical protein
MNKLEEIHYENGVNDLEYAPCAAEITTDVAVKFAEFSSQYYDEDLMKDQWFNHSLNAEKKILTTKELFEIFINNHYGK